MFDYKCVLIATDLSPHGKKILARALAMASESDAEVHLIHVVEHSPLSYAGEFSIPIDGNVEQQIEAEALLIMQNIAAKYNIKSENICLSQGSVKRAVTEHAKKIHADLIVVGSHGFGAMDILLGSRANAILHNAPCDIWVFKDKQKK